MKSGFSYSTIPPEPDEDGVYMRRWVFATPWFTVRLHNILRSDNARHGHCHPWRGFVSVVLRGSYLEQHFVTHREYVPYVRRPWKPYVRRKSDYHKVMLINGEPVWSFVVTWGREGEWGFLVPCEQGISLHCDSKFYGPSPKVNF